MPITERAKSFLIGLYENQCALDLVCDLDRLAADAAQRRHGQRVTLRDLRVALRQVIAEREAWAWTEQVAL